MAMDMSKMGISALTKGNLFGGKGKSKGNSSNSKDKKKPNNNLMDYKFGSKKK